MPVALAAVRLYTYQCNGRRTLTFYCVYHNVYTYVHVQFMQCVYMAKYIHGNYPCSSLKVELGLITYSLRSLMPNLLPAAIFIGHGQLYFNMPARITVSGLVNETT